MRNQSLARNHFPVGVHADHRRVHSRRGASEFFGGCFIPPDENAQRPQSGHFGVVSRLSGAFIGLGPLGEVKLHNGVAQQTIRPRPVGQDGPIIPAPRDAPSGRIIPLPLPPPLFRIPPKPASGENERNEKNNGEKKRPHLLVVRLVLNVGAAALNLFSGGGQVGGGQAF